MNRRKGRKKIAYPTQTLFLQPQSICMYGILLYSVSVKFSFETSSKIRLKLPIFSKIIQDSQFSFFLSFFFFFSIMLKER